VEATGGRQRAAVDTLYLSALAVAGNVSISKQKGARRGAQCALHIDLGGDALQPADPGAVPAVIETWQKEVSSTYRLQEKVSHYLECHDAGSAAIAVCYCQLITLFFFN
jgi:hypothetical protein